MGILSTKPGKSPKIIVSDDKDMKTIPGLLYRQGELIEVTEADADYWHMYQTLIGDSADGYAGLPGCGPKTAEKILNFKDGEQYCTWTGHTAWRVVVEAFEAKGLTADDTLLQARLARILRNSDFDPITKKVKLWTPPA
jgi:DNA polymerase-1